MTKLQWINLGLRGIMETGIILAFAYWGYHAGESTTLRIIFAILVPAAGFGFWGAVDFHKTGRMAEILRLVQELFISGLAAVMLFFAGQHTAAWILGTVSVVHHTLLYLNGDRLQKKTRNE